MNAHRAFLEKETRELIKTVSGFQEGEENFDICLNYALAHFTSFEHPDVDWFKVKKRISGLCERFAVDTEHERARKLKSISTRYLDIINNEEIKKKANGFAILSFLCSMSGSVKEDEYPSILKSITKSGDANEDSLYWSKMLREDDLDVKSITISDDDDESDWTESEEEEESKLRTLQLSSPPPPSVDSGLGETPDSCCAPFPAFEPFRPYKEPEPPKPPVHIENPYWNPYYQQTKIRSRGDGREQFTKTWERHLEKRCAIYMPERNILLKERNVLREILWMLHGTRKSFLFPWVNGCFHVREHVHMAHITEETLQKMIRPLCHYGDKMVVLMDFIKNMQSLSSPPNCQTVKAYATGMHLLVLQYIEFLQLCEKLIIDQKEVMTFFKLKMILEPELRFLLLLSNLHSQLMERIQKCRSAFERATILLDTLWSELAFSNLWMTKSKYLQAILMLFLTSLYPYVHMLESSISLGQLIDPYSEFLLQSETTMEASDENFWGCGMKLRHLPDSMLSFFLCPLFDDILLASKSIKMVQAFRDIYEDDLYMNQQQGRLFPEFVERFEKLYTSLGQTAFRDPPREEIGDMNYSFEDYDMTAAIADIKSKQCKRLPHQRELFESMKKECLDINENHRFCQRVVQMVEAGTPIPICSILQEALLPCVKTACQSSKKALTKALKMKYHLVTHISIMKRYFLLESGDTMFSFYTDIFRKIIDGEEWENSTYLNCAFKEFIPHAKFDGSEGLLLNLDNEEEEDDKTCQSLLFGLNRIDMSYKVEWPVSMILNKNVQDIYCKIFRFLLQVKCVKYCLDDLYCIRLNGKRKRAPGIARMWIKNTEISEKQVIHGMHVLRIKLLHFINGYHSYIMTHILHGSGIELDQKLEAAESLDDILTAHNEYIYGLQENCLLDSKHTYLWEHIQILLDITIRFQTIWRTGPENIDIKEIQGIEQQYSSSINFLMSYLSKPRKRGCNLHLDALASGIFTKFQHHQVFAK